MRYSIRNTRRTSVRAVGFDEAKAARQLEAARAEAPHVGWCKSCGLNVDEPGGKLHDRWCIVEPDRRYQS